MSQPLIDKRVQIDRRQLSGLLGADTAPRPTSRLRLTQPDHAADGPQPPTVRFETTVDPVETPEAVFLDPAHTTATIVQGIHRLTNVLRLEPLDLVMIHAVVNRVTPS